MKVQQLQTNHLNNPLGYRFDNLFFSWEVVDTLSATDVWTKVEIALDESFESIVHTSGEMKCYGKPYYAAPFHPEEQTRYYWRVMVATKKDGISTSIPAYFETALTESEWNAEWISTVSEGEAMPEFYKHFVVEKQVKQARVYSYAVGLYEGYLNGEKMGDEFLLPGYHSYDFIQQYQTYDITENLRLGENKIAFRVGEGWYKGRFVFDGGYENLYGNRKKLIALIKIEYVDGSIVWVPTDKTWKANETEILTNNIYDGEIINTLRERQSLQVVVLEDAKDKLMPRCNVPIRKVEKYQVKKIFHTPSGATVLDFGEVITGWVEVMGSGDMDFVLRYGEFMQNQELYRDNLRTAKAEFVYKGKADGKWLRPHFTYYGFRYVQVEGIEEIREEQFVAYRLMSDIEQTGTIKTSNAKINQLVANSICSQKCNFLDVPLDCPQRDERMGWTGDIALFANTGSYLMYTPAFLDHYMLNMKLEQKALGGAIPFFVPKPKPAFHEGINPFLVDAGACTWGDAATIVPWVLYTHYEDKEMLRRHYPVMRSWVEYMNGRVQENVKPHLWQNDRQLGDWLALDNGNIHNPIGRTDTGLIATAYYYYSTTLCEKAAEVLGYAEEAKRWKKQARNIREAFIEEYLDETGELKGEKTQTAYALILKLGLYQSGKKQILKDGLKQQLALYNNHLSTGFVGTGMLMDALSDNGMEEEAYMLLLQEDYPSWLREVNLGATTIWERWNSVNDDGTISDTGMNSLNHYTYGCVTGWMFENLCGFGWKRQGEFLLAPKVDKRLQFVEGQYKSCYGSCLAKWEWKADGQIGVSVQVPFQAKMHLILPWGEERMLETGTYFFEA